MKFIKKKTLLIYVFIFLIECQISTNIIGARLSIFSSSLEKLASIGVFLASDRINEYDEHGFRNGMWIEENDFNVMIVNYISDKRNGMEMIYDKYKNSLKLSYILRYSIGELKSITMIDEKSGLISGFVDNIEANDESINYPVNWESGFKFPYIGYSTYYNPIDGRIESEGYEIFGEDWEMDCERVGEWKIYDEYGNYIVKDYGGLQGGLRMQRPGTGRAQGLRPAVAPCAGSLEP